MTTAIKRQTMLDRKLILDQIRVKLFYGNISAIQRKAIVDILDYWEQNYDKKNNQCLAYILATADYETDRKFNPIADKTKGFDHRYGLMEKMNGQKYSSPLKLYYRRGIIPLLWYENYKYIGSKLGIDILYEPDFVMEKHTSIRILVDGMMQGWFTGYRLDDFFQFNCHQWADARKVINRSEKNQLIKSLAIQYHMVLS